MTKLPRKFQNEYKQATIDGDVTYYVGEAVRALGSRGTILKVSQNSAYIQFKGYEMEAAWSDIKKISEEERRESARSHKKIALPEQVRPSTKHPSHRKTRGDVLKRDTDRASEGISQECEREIRARDEEIENLRRANEALQETTERLNRECREYNQSAMNVTPDGEIVPTHDTERSTKKRKGVPEKAKKTRKRATSTQDEGREERAKESLHAIRERRETEENHQYSRRELCRIVADVLDIDGFDYNTSVYLNADTDEILLVTQLESEKKRIEEKLGYNSSTVHIKAKTYEIHNDTYYVFVIDQWAQDSILIRYLREPYKATVRHIFDNSIIETSTDGVRFYPARREDIDRYNLTLSESDVHYGYRHVTSRKPGISQYEYSLTMEQWHELRRWFDAKADKPGHWNDRYSQDLPFYIKNAMKKQEATSSTNTESQQEAVIEQDAEREPEVREPEEREPEEGNTSAESDTENEDLDRAESSMNAIQELLRKALKR